GMTRLGGFPVVRSAPAPLPLTLARAAGSNERAMKLRRLLAFAVLVVVLVLGPMAFSSLPDQLWLGGIWDDDDWGDVSLLMTAHSPAISAKAVWHASTVLSIVVFRLEYGERSTPAPPLPS